MIMLTKLNDEKIILNCEQVEAVEFIPGSKSDYDEWKVLYRESGEEIIEKTIEYNGKIRSYVNK